MFEQTRIIPIVLGFLIDAFLGDPENPYHPIRGIGAQIAWWIRLYKKINIQKPWLQFLFGVLMALCVVGVTVLVTVVLLMVAGQIHWVVKMILEAVCCYFLLSAKALWGEGKKIYESLEKENLPVARKQLSFIVGRDTENLSVEKIIKATIETIFENLSDGVIAPLFFLFIGGVPLGVAYKAINTLDSMVGYRNETFEYVGKFSARLDDLWNFIPARLSALLLLLSGMLQRADVVNGWSVYWKDRYQHLSPNSAHTEAMGAGLLGISLGGTSFYGGKMVGKPTIGKEKVPITLEKMKETNRLMYGAAWLGLLVGCVLWHWFMV